MAARYWVGGNNSWDATAGSKWALTSGGAGGQAVPNSADTVFFDANSGASTVTIGAGTAICSTLTMTGFTGTLAFGSNSITIASNGTNVFLGATTYSVTGTPLINLTYSGSAGISVAPASVTEANSISFNISAGSYSFTIGGAIKNLTFSGTYTGNLVSSSRTIYGNLTFKTGMTVGAGGNATTFAATSGTQTITSAGLVLDFPTTLGTAFSTTAATGNGTTATLTFGAQTTPPFAVGSTINVVGLAPAGYNGTYTVTACTTNTVSYANATSGAQTTAGSVGTTNTVQLIDALTLGSTRSLTHTSGTFDLTNKTVTAGTFNQGVSNVVRTMAFGTTGTLNLTGNNTNVMVCNGSTPSVLTGNPTVNLTYAGAVGTRAVLTGSNSNLSTHRYNFFITAGSDTVNFQNHVGSLDFTGFSGTWQNQTLGITGNVTLSPTMTVGGGTNTVTFANWGGTHQLASSGKSLDFPITIGFGITNATASGNGTTATLTFASSFQAPTVGSFIQVTGMAVAGYNGSFTVTAASPTSLSYAATATGASIGTFGTASTVQLQDAFIQPAGIATRVVTLSFGGFDLNNKTCTMNYFNSTNTALRTLAFGTSQINILGSGGTVWNTVSTSGLTVTGSDPTVNFTYNGATGFRNIGNNITSAVNNGPMNFNVTAGTDIVSFAGNFYCKNADFTGFSGTFSNTGNTGNSGNIFWYGNLTISTNMSITAGTGTWTWAGTSGTQTITSAGKNFNSAITFAGTAIYQLLDNLSVGTATPRVITLTSGTLDLNDKTLTNFGSFSSSNSNTRAILFGTTGNYTNTYNLSAGGTLWFMPTATGFSITGIPSINITGAPTAGTRTLQYGSSAQPPSPEANSLSIYVTAGSDTVSLTGSFYFRNLDFTGAFTGTLSANTRIIYGNLKYNASMTVAAGSNITTFAGTSGTQQITSAGKNPDCPITFSGTAIYQLQDALSVGTVSGRGVTLTSGTLDLNNNNLTIYGTFTGSGSATRTIAFGTGQIYLTQTSGSIWSLSGTNLNITGTPTVNVTANATTGERTFVHVPTAVSQALAINLNVTAGSADFGFGSGNQLVNNLNFSGFTGRTGNAGMTSAGRFNVYGNITMGAGMTTVGAASEVAWQLLGSGTQLITSNGVAFSSPFSLSGIGTYSLQDAFVIGATRQIAFNSGTLQTNGYNLTCGNFTYVNSNVKALNLGASTITILGGTSTLGWEGSNAGTTYTSVTSSTIVFTTTGTTAFSGGQGGGSGNQFGTVRMSGLGGTLNLGAGTILARCTTLDNTVAPCTITNGCTTGFTVNNFNVNGTAGNLVTLNSNVPGTRRTINQASGIVNAEYMNIQDSAASGGATWNALNSTNAGNNTGWNFLTTNSGNFFMMF